VVILHRGVL